MTNRRYVKPNANGGWDVLKHGERRASVTASSQGKAISRARDIVRREGGGEIRVMNPSGKVLSADTVPKRRVKSSKSSAT